jgi:hypothetical protein
VEPDEPLSHVAPQLRAGGHLEILAIGSGTMLGAPGDPEGGFPVRAARVLQDASPGVVVHVTMHGGRGLTASEMLAMLKRELAAHRYSLVLWQTGTVEAISKLPSDEFHRILLEGAQAARNAGADLVLIDPQFTRFLNGRTDLAPYEHTLQATANLPGVTIFRRYALMQHWVETGQLDLERATRWERRKTIERLHACLAQSLAAMVLRGASMATR